jgi:hypothetical protein
MLILYKVKVLVFEKRDGTITVARVVNNYCESSLWLTEGDRNQITYRNDIHNQSDPYVGKSVAELKADGFEYKSTEYRFEDAQRNQYQQYDDGFIRIGEEGEEGPTIPNDAVQIIESPGYDRRLLEDLAGDQLYS